MKISVLMGTVGLAASMFLNACGSSGGTCSNTAPCGGNIVGSWNIASSCLQANGSMFDAQCPMATVMSSNLTFTGKSTYNADMTYSTDVTVNGRMTVTLPSSCLMAQGVTVTCQQLNDLFALAPTPGIKINCTGSSSCACTETFTNAAVSGSGTYTTTAAGLLTFNTSQGTVEENDYCVKGTTLTVSPHADSGMMGQAVEGTITYTKI